MINYTKNQKRVFADEVLKQMKSNDKIMVVVGDLGYRMWDKVREAFPERFINVGAAEQTLIGVGVGLSLGGKIPIIYSITPFLLYRPFETIRNYINHDKTAVKLVGSGRDKDYGKEGFSHWALEDKMVMKIFKNIKAFWPKSYKEIPGIVSKMIKDKSPYYINLKKR